MEDISEVQQIPASIVRDVAQSLPSPGDFRQRFPVEQEDLSNYIFIRFDDIDEVAAEFAGRLGAALWAIYERSTGVPSFPVLDSKQVETLEPVSRQLLENIIKSHSSSYDDEFDPEWLIDLRQGPQPHVMGFLIGALRATRLGLSGEIILELAVVLLAVAGVLEAAAARLRKEMN